jgi:pimeloyl-ACP methyl ester carboxylesterase
MRILAFICRTATALVVSLAAPALSQTSVASKPKTAAHVYLLRGLLNLSPGIDEMGSLLQRRGINATVHNHLEWAALAEQAIANCKSGRESPIILIGHSMGAAAAVYMADRLRQEDVQVSLVVTLDPVVKTTVYGNVSRVENYYFSNGIGTTVERASGFRGSLQNVDMKDHAELGHISLTTSDAVQRQIIGDVMAALHGRCH